MSEQSKHTDQLAVELKKAQSESQIMQSVGKLRQSMVEMKDKEVARAKEAVKEMKEQMERVKRQEGGSAAKGEKEGESAEELRAKVHSLAYLN